MAVDGQQGQPKPKAKRVRKPKQPIAPVPDSDDAHVGNSKLARALGSCDYHSREKGVQALTRFMQRKAELQERDMLKIWKGLFYAFWHSDKQPVQEELAERLAAVLSDLKPEVAYMYFTCFIHTMRREWFGIDRLRLDKFLMLIRKFINRMFKVLSDSHWDAAIVTRYMDYLATHVLLPSDTIRALGVTYHLADIFLPELKKMVATAVEAGAKAERVAVPGEALVLLLKPACRALSEVSDAPLVVRVKEGVFDTLVEDLRNPDEVNALRHLDAPALASQLFDLGARQGTLSRNREALYTVSKALEKAQFKRSRKQEGTQPGGSGRLDSGANASTTAPTAPTPAAGSTDSAKKKQQKRKAPGADGSAATAGDATAVGSAATAAADEGGASPSPGARTQPSQQRPAQAGTSGQGAGLSPQGQAAASGGKAKKGKLGAGMGQGGAPGSVSGSPAGAAPQLQPVHSAAALRQAKSAIKGSALKGAAAKAAAGDRKRDASVAFAGVDSAATTPQPAAGQRGDVDQSTGRKRVQINLRKNLYFECGGPVPPPEIRTPQTARSKGGILKKSAHATPKTAPAKLKFGSGSGSGSGPHSKLKVANMTGSVDRQQQAKGPHAVRGNAGRAKAALFF